MIVRTMAVLAAFVLSGGVASSQTVTLDFTSGTASGVQGTGVLSQGSFTTGGFDLDFSYVEDGLGDVGQPFSAPRNIIGILSNCGDFGGCASYSTQMTISRSDGETFSLFGVDTAATYEGFNVVASFTPFLDDGVTLDNANAVSTFLPILQHSLMFQGLKEDSSTVIVRARTASAANLGTGFGDLGVAGTNSGFGPAATSFSPGDLAVLSDLTELMIVTDDFVLENLGAARAMQDLGAPIELLQGLDQCGFTSCTIAGVGEFEFNVDVLGGRNDTIAVQLSGITLKKSKSLYLAPTLSKFKIEK